VPYEPALAEAEEAAAAPAEGGEGASVEELMQPAPGDVESAEEAPAEQQTQNA
jgi:hypothetical protein